MPHTIDAPRNPHLPRGILCVVALCALSLPATAQDAQAPLPASSLAPAPTDAGFVFAGRYHNDHFDKSFNPFYPEYEDNYVIGAGYQHFFLEGNDFRLGAEVGLSARFGEATSGEIWAGTVLRYDGWVLGDTIRISPSVTFGVSVVTDTMGVERQREIENGSDATALFYLSPELNFSTADNPDLEVFWRLHHRSGAWGTFNGMADAANATSLGVRWHF